MEKEKTSLTDKHKKFVFEYLKCFNATQAAIKAGYSKKSAAETGSIILRNPNIREAIEKEFDKAGYAVQLALRETLKIASSDMKDFVEIEPGGAVRLKPFDEIPEGLTSCIKSIEEDRVIKESADGKESMIKHDKLRYKLYDKQKAISDILRVAGKYLDKQEIKHDIAGLSILFQDDPNESKENEPKKPNKK